MSSVSAVLPAPPERVFSLLEDPGTWAVVIPGARRIRRFDARWPEVGTRVHHTIGIAPLVLRDSTEVVDLDQPHHLRLQGRARPLVSVDVDLRLLPHAGGTELVLQEWAVGGLLGRGRLARLFDLAVTVRNRELCRRLRRQASQRFAAGSPAGGGGA